MPSTIRSAAVAAALAALALPSLSLADPPADNPGAAHRHAQTHVQSDHGHGKRHAYGVACRGESKRHVKGEKGTPFSQCVTAMAKLATGKADTARTACKALSKKHLKGEKGTPFSRCVAAAAKLRHEQRHGGDVTATS